MLPREDFRGRTVGEIVAFVHARLASSDARRRFEVARNGLSHGELVDLAARTLDEVVARTA